MIRKHTRAATAAKREDSIQEPRRPRKRNEAKKEVGRERCMQKLCRQKAPLEGNWSVSVNSFHKAGKIRRKFPAQIQKKDRQG